MTMMTFMKGVLFESLQRKDEELQKKHKQMMVRFPLLLKGFILILTNLIVEVVETKKTVRSKAQGKQAAASKSAKNSRTTSEIATPNFSSVASPSTAPTSVGDSGDDIGVLSAPMSSKQATRLARALSRKKTYAGLADSSDENDADYVDGSEGEDDVKEIAVKVLPRGGRSSTKEELDTDSEIEEISTKASKKKKAPRSRKGPMSEEEKESRARSMYLTWKKSLYAHHPHLEHVFTEMAQEPEIVPTVVDQPDGMTIQLLPFQKEGLHWLVEQEKRRYHGGILADEMGMGKTIQTIALFLSDDPETRSGPNLVIAPVVALMQWKNEIEAHTGGRLKTLIYHGKGKNISKEEMMKYDVILSTYSLLESVYRKQVYGFKRKNGLVKEKSVIHGINFHRIVLDEAHNVKDRNAGTTRSVSSILAEKRLCLSGTPLQNRIGELYSLLRFLHVEPFNQYFCRKCDCAKDTYDFDGKTCKSCGHFYGVHHNFFNFSILSHIQKSRQGDNEIAMKHLRLLLHNLMLRRTKIERADDLGLPPRVVEIRRDYFNPEEKDLYESIYSDSTRKFNTFVAQGVVLNNYANIFTLITRMRQVADHPDLVLKRHLTASGYVQNTLVCQLCNDAAEEAIESRCHHTFCRMCIEEYCTSWSGPENELECPVCHVGLSIDLTAPAIEMAEAEIYSTGKDSSSAKKKSIINRINMTGGWRSSTKIEGLVEELYKLRSNKQTIKSIVFSQFTSMLDLVEWRLNRAGFQTVKLQGSMQPAQRDAIIKHFMNNPQVEVFLVSLKAGGVALNLCEASQVFIMDPWWNPSVEWQSGDRVHRIGQHRPVKITRLIIQDSIESRIVELQEKKASMINATIGSDDAALQRLSTADVQFLFQI